jgi:hypothetical protein
VRCFHQLTAEPISQLHTPTVVERMQPFAFECPYFLWGPVILSENEMVELVGVPSTSVLLQRRGMGYSARQSPLPANHQPERHIHGLTYPQRSLTFERRTGGRGVISDCTHHNNQRRGQLVAQIQPDGIQCNSSFRDPALTYDINYDFGIH